MKIIFLISFLVSTCSASFDYDIVLVNPVVNEQANAAADPNTVTYPATQSEFTFCFWIYPNDDTTHFPFTYSAGGGLQASMSINSTNIEVVILGSPISTTGTFIQPNEWSHICYTWSNIDGDVNVYVNGGVVLTYPGAFQGSPFPTADALVVIGQSYNADPDPIYYTLNGRISFFHYWSMRFNVSDVLLAKGCLEFMVGDIINWNIATWLLQTKASLQQTTLPCYLNQDELDEPINLSKLQLIAIAYLEYTGWTGRITRPDTPTNAIAKLLVDLNLLELIPDDNSPLSAVLTDALFYAVDKFTR